MALGFLGSAISAGVNSLEARRARHFQEDMRATQYQIAMEDMRKAGLNPILAGQVGGSTTGSAAQARVAISGQGDTEAVKNLSKVKLEREILKAQQAELVQRKGLLMDQQSESGLRQEEQDMRNKILQLELNKAPQQAIVDASEAGQMSIKAGRLWQNTSGAVSGAAGAARDLLKGRIGK